MYFTPSPQQTAPPFASSIARKKFAADCARERGRAGEAFAIDLYRKARFEILETSYHYGHYEVDFIARRGQIVHFVEVKTRKTLADANFALSDLQFQRIFAAAEQFMQAYPNLLFQLDAMLIDHEFHWERIDNIMIQVASTS